MPLGLGSMTSMTSTWSLQMRGHRNTLDAALVPVCTLILVPRSRRTREFKTPRALWPVAACRRVSPEAIVVPSAIYGEPYIDAWIFVPVECKYFFSGRLPSLQVGATLAPTVRRR